MTPAGDGPSTPGSECRSGLPSIGCRGSGTGYFTWKLSDAVGASGRVYAVEVEDELVGALERGVAERDVENVEVVRGDYDDPKLPDGQLDVVLLSSVYHHADERVAQWSGCAAISRPARIAILEPRAGWESWLLLLPPGHGVAPDTIRAEMREAGYRPVASFDFLPAHRFEVFAVAAE